MPKNDWLEWDRAYEYLVARNGELLGMLHWRIVNGPIDWQKETRTPAKAAIPSK